MTLIDFLQEHKAAAAGAGMAAVHFAHLLWPRLVAIFPYCRDNGGVVGIVNLFLFGRPAAPIARAAAAASPQLETKT